MHVCAHILTSHYWSDGIYMRNKLRAHAMTAHVQIEVMQAAQMNYGIT